MRLMRHDNRDSGDRTLQECTNCRQRKPKEFGRYIPYNEGMNQKWVCGQCYEKRNHR
jgi:hypothetical protein